MPIVISNTSKLPEGSTSLPISACPTGSKLACKTGSICSVCYGGKGRYVSFPDIEKALQWRLALWENSPNKWVSQLITGINRKRKPMEFFRWFDVGDVQSTDMMQAIIKVCDGTPNTRHWLPTKEYAIVRDLFNIEIPSNLIIRVSSPMIDAPPVKWARHTGTAHTVGKKWIGKKCKAGDTSPPSCGTCRACWDSSVPNVSYPIH